MDIAGCEDGRNMKRVVPLLGLGLTAMMTCPTASAVAAVAKPSVVDPCTQATTHAIESMRSTLDRIEADTQAVLDAGDLDEVVGQMSSDLVESCDIDGIARGVSELIVYVSGEASVRAEPAATFAQDFVTGACGGVRRSSGIELTSPRSGGVP